MLKYFLKFRVHDSRVGFSFSSNGLGYQMPCGPLIKFQKIETHSRVCDGCHVSTFSGRDMTLLAYDEEVETVWNSITIFDGI